MARPLAPTRIHPLPHDHPPPEDLGCRCTNPAQTYHFQSRLLPTSPLGCAPLRCMCTSTNACPERSLSRCGLWEMKISEADAQSPAPRLLPACDCLLNTAGDTRDRRLLRSAQVLVGGATERPPRERWKSGHHVLRIRKTYLCGLEMCGPRSLSAHPRSLREDIGATQGGRSGVYGHMRPAESAAEGTTVQDTWLPVDKTDTIAARIEFPIGKQSDKG